MRCILLWVPFCCTALFAQTGDITGVVTDPGGAAVPALKATVTEDATGTRRFAETNAAGSYSAPSLF